MTAIQDFMFLVHFLNNQAEHWFREIHLTEKSYYLNLPSVWLLRKIKEKNTNEFCLFSVYVVSVYWVTKKLNLISEYIFSVSKQRISEL